MVLADSARFLVSRRTQDTARLQADFVYGTFTPVVDFSKSFDYQLSFHHAVLLPPPDWFGSAPVRSRY